MRKKALLALMAAAVISTNVQASTYTNENLVNARVAPGLDAPIVAQLIRGTEVDVLEWDVGDSWAHVNTQYGPLYIYNELLSTDSGAMDVTRIANEHNSWTGKLIVVDRAATQTYVFAGGNYNWSLEAAFPCCVGKPETPTPAGTFVIENKRSMINSGDTWEYFMNDFAYDSDGTAWGFHSVLCAPGTYDPVDDRLGCNISNGCIRLGMGDVQWIWNTCPVGTRVVIV